MKLVGILLLIIFGFSIGSANASPKVIYEGPNVQSIRSYIPPTASSVPDFKLSDLNNDQFVDPDREQYPLKTRIRPLYGIKSRRVNYPNLPLPICIIGDDDWSKTWLIKAYPFLESLHAICWVISVSSANSLLELKKLAPTVTMSPANGDAIASYFGLRGYPVLISKGMITQ